MENESNIRVLKTIIGGRTAEPKGFDRFDLIAERCPVAVVVTGAGGGYRIREP